MANHTSHALPYPVKGARYTVGIEYLNSSGVPTDPTTPDTEFSLDGAAFADCAEEVTTITGSNGCGYITLTGAETNGSLVMLAAKVASGPNNKLLSLYPRTLAAIYSGTATAGGASTITLGVLTPAVQDMLIGAIVKTTGGTGGGGTGGANNQARVIVDYSTSRVATVSPAWEVQPDNTTTYEILLTESCLLRLSNLVLLNSNPAPLVNMQDFFDGTGYGVNQARFTLASAPTQTSLLFAGGFETDNAYKGYMVRITDPTAGEDGGLAGSVRLVTASSYTTGVTTLTLDSAPDFTVGASDTLEFLLPSLDQFATAIKAKTDQLTFTVANQVDANTKAIDDDLLAAANEEAFFDGTGYGVHPGRFSLVGINSQVSWRFSGGFQTDNAYRGYLVRITNPTAGENGGVASALRVVLASSHFVGVNTLTVDSAPEFTVVGAGDTIELFPPSFAYYDRNMMPLPIRRNNATAGTGNTITLDAAASAQNDAYNGYLLHIVSGTGAGQAAFIQDYDGPSKMATMNVSWVTNPTVGSEFMIYPIRFQFTGENVNSNVAAGSLSGVMDSAALASIGVAVETEVNDRLLSADSTSRLERSTRAIALGIVAGGASTTSIPTSSLNPAATTADQFKNAVLIFDSVTTTAALRGQRAEITASTSGGTLTVAPALTTAPASGDSFTII